MMRTLLALIPALILTGCLDRLDLSSICRPGDPACAEQDYDGDGVINALDNCATVKNPNQADSDGDGIGDSCEDLDLGEPVACTGSQCLVFESFDVYSDDNGDRVVNKGETVRIRVFLKNKSSKSISELSGTLSSQDPLVTISDPASASWGTLAGNEVDYGTVQGGYYYSFEFTVDASAQSGHQIPMLLSAADAYGSTWQLSFSITVDALNAELAVSRVVVYSDDNGDKAINKGETVRVQVFLRNSGDSSILDLEAVLSTSDPYVTVSNPDSASWSTLAAAEEDYGTISGGYYYSYEFSVDPSAPDGHQIAFSLAAADQHQNTWTLPFSLTVEDLGASLMVSRVTVYSDDNGDKAINKGETVRLQVFLRNTGESTVLDLSAVLSTSDPFVTVSYPDSASWGNLAPAEEDSGQVSGGYYYSYEITVSEDAPDDHQAQFALAAEDAYGNAWPLDFSLTVEDLAATLVFSRYEVYSDDNGNDLAEPGETVRIKVYLRNTGTSQALDVTAVLSATDANASVSYPDSALWGHMTAAEEDYGERTGAYYYSYEIVVSPAASGGQNMGFALAISDKFNNNWDVSFQIPIY